MLITEIELQDRFQVLEIIPVMYRIQTVVKIKIKFEWDPIDLISVIMTVNGILMLSVKDQF